MPNGRIIGAGLVVTGLALAVWGFAEREADDTSAITQSIKVVELHAGSGDVRIETGDTTSVREHREYWLLNTGKAHRVEGDKLVLDGNCGWQCSVSYVVTVPAGTKVTGKTTSGDVALKGVGDIDLKAASGNVTATGSAGAVKLDLASGDAVVAGANGAVELETESGDITATDLAGGPVRASAASGDIELGLKDPMSVNAEAKSGDIAVHVPVRPDAKYKVDADTKSGETDVKIPADPAGTNVLTLITKSGDVQVTGTD